MITIETEKHFRQCNSCSSGKGVMSLHFGSEKATSSIALCSDCRKQLGKMLNPIVCPHCGTTEMLCGYNGVGCSSARRNNE